ncbi:DUF6711 family protein [Clostridium sp. BJN0001]|uniref:DUF6711 family protein n=1 Tax=Clostridium sp. BJN0001 TaxID=2930219 RepID=UPI001FD1C5B6|nr:DUF6711 family protein [Clostridium sp. BJN0001]
MTIEVNGIDFKPYLTNCQISIVDVDGDTTRNAEGTLTRDRIAVKRKISFEFGVMTKEELSIILTAVSNSSFSVNYTDPQSNKNKTGEFYVGDRPVTNLLLNLYKDVKFNIIEL